jgi:hypothetical protein
MQEILPLNVLWNQYSQGLLAKKLFEGRIFQYLLENQRRYRLADWNRDRFIDYLSWLYPRLSRSIDLYKNTGASFDSYIGAVIHWSAKEYRFRDADHSVTEYACWKLKAEELEVRSPEPVYSEPLSLPERLPNPQQLLILLLKSYFFISEDFLARAAPVIGMEKEKLRYLIDELRKRRLKRDEEVRGLQERIYCQYYRCIAFENRLNAVAEDSAYYEKMKGRLERARIRLGTMKKRLAGIRLNPTNRQIANLLGIPKGTVDSSLFTVKSKWTTGNGERRP